MITQCLLVLGLLTRSPLVLATPLDQEQRTINGDDVLLQSVTRDA